jgi:hypothetical protein
LLAAWARVSGESFGIKKRLTLGGDMAEFGDASQAFPSGSPNKELA